MGSSDVKFSVSHLAAQAVVFAVVERARALGVPRSVAVLDASGVVMALCRMGGAPLVSAEVAQSQAFTALFGPSPPSEVLPPGVARLPRLGSVGAGLAIVVEGQAIGAIGVGGGTAEQDLECAQAGLAALRETGAPREPSAASWERRAGVDGR